MGVIWGVSLGDETGGSAQGGQARGSARGLALGSDGLAQGVSLGVWHLAFANFGQGCSRELKFCLGIAKFKELGGWAEKIGNFTWLVAQKDNFANFG